MAACLLHPCWLPLTAMPLPQLHGPGGLPHGGSLVPETSVWRPPTAVKVGSGLWAAGLPAHIPCLPACLDPA